MALDVLDNAHESRVMHCTQYSWREVLHPILPEGRRPEGCIGCNTSRQLYWVQCITSDECALSNTSSAILAAMSLLLELGIHNQKRCYIQYLPRDVLTSIHPTGCIVFSIWKNSWNGDLPKSNGSISFMIGLAGQVETLASVGIWICRFLLLSNWVARRRLASPLHCCVVASQFWANE